MTILPWALPVSINRCASRKFVALIGDSAAVMGGTNGWEYTARKIDGGAMITVIVPPQDKAKIKALGFFGMKASGSHHQAHHWMMASGHNPHR